MEGHPMKPRCETKEIPKPWGREILLGKPDRYVLKMLEVKKGCSLSLQFHRKKRETLYFLSGLADMQFGKRNFAAKPGEFVVVEPGTVHRITARKLTKILEASTPELDDVVRLKDDYGRIPAKAH